MMSLPAAQSSSRRPATQGGWRLRVRGAGVVIVVATALADQIRWRASPAKWSSFDVLLPLGPDMATLFLILGAAIGLHVFGTRRWQRRAVIALAILAAAPIAGVLLPGQAGARLRVWENWVASSPFIVNGIAVEQVSGQSAVLVLLTCAALIGLHVRPARTMAPSVLGMIAASLVELFALVAVLSYAAGNPVVAIDGWLQVPPLAMFEFALCNLVLLMNPALTGRLRQWFFGVDVDEQEIAPISREEKRVFAVLAAVGLVALVASVVYLRKETRDYREQSVEALQRIADLKVGQIEQWRHERYADARSFMQMPGLGGNIAALSRPGQNAQRARFAAWLQQFVQNYGYAGIVVFDASLQPVLGEPAGTKPTAPGWEQRLQTLRPDSDVIELPPYVDEAGHLRWDLLVPLQASTTAALEGALLLQSNPTRFIIPILQSWPAEYQTGQSVLWYREGDRLTSLGGYRPAAGVTAQELRPLGMSRSIAKLPPDSLPARVVRGETTGGEGLDYRGVSIIGLGRAVRDSPWLFSSRLDSSEIYAPLRRTAVGVAGAVAGLLLTMGIATSRLWRQRQRNLLHDRLAAELEQKRLAARLGLVMRQAKDSIFVTDEGMRFVDANQQAMDTYGWSRDELLQMTIPDLRAADTASPLPIIFERANTAEGMIFETMHQRKDGSKFPVEISARRLELEGRPQMVAIIRDISERRAAEIKLQSSEQKFSKAFKANPSGIVISELATGRYIEVNESFCRLLRYSPDQLIGRTSVELGIWVNSAQRADVFNPLLNGGSLRNVEMQVLTRDGETKTVLINAELIDLNETRCVVSLVEDITDRKRTEAKLRQLSSIIEQAPLSVIITDLAGAIEYVNPKCCAVTGYTREELIGQTPRIFKSGEVAAGTYEDLWRTIAEKRVWIGEMKNRKKTGEIFLETLVIAPLVDPTGEVTHYVALKDDITAQKRFEAETTAMLAKERELSDMKSQFISVASHEFRTPLAAATGSLELLERHAARITEVKRLELLGRAQHSLRRLTTIMDNVLQLSRADSGRVKPKPSTVDLVQFVRDIIRDVEMADRQQHTFDFQPSGSGSAVPIDTNLLNHILSNLLGNAVRYSPGGTRISVRLEAGEQSFACTVADEGIGIPEAERERVFEPFTRGSNVGQINGTGLGLNIVKRYAEMMGGSIELLRVERGAAFRIRLPWLRPEK